MNFDPIMIQEIIDRILDLIIGILPILALTRSIGKNVDKVITPGKEVKELIEQEHSNEDGYDEIVAKLQQTQELIASFSDKIHSNKK